MHTLIQAVVHVVGFVWNLLVKQFPFWKGTWELWRYYLTFVMSCGTLKIDISLKLFFYVLPEPFSVTTW